jgi:hypothetical protein
VGRGVSRPDAGRDLAPWDAGTVRPAGHVFGLFVIRLFLVLVLRGPASLRCAAVVLEILARPLGLEDRTPCANTGRGWMLRVGLYALLCPLERADDWIWLADHTLQLGPLKCHVVVGIRRLVWEQNRGPLTHADVTLLGLLPMAQANGEAVAAHLESIVARVGAPRAVITDGGPDLKRGLEIFREAHPETVHLRDLKHKHALLLKTRLAADPHWTAFVAAANQLRLGITQTDLAFLNPPALKTKARFMNLDRLVHWARRALKYLNHPPASAADVDHDRVRNKLQWLRAYRRKLREWSGWLKLIRTTEAHVHASGLHRGLRQELARRLKPLADSPSGRRLLREILEFVSAQTRHLKPHERVPGTTEVLESIIGKYKRLQSSHSAGGMTPLLLSIGAFVGQTTDAFILQALETIRTADVDEWCRENLGQTLQSQRRQAFAAQQN